MLQLCNLIIISFDCLLPKTYTIATEVYCICSHLPKRLHLVTNAMILSSFCSISLTAVVSLPKSIFILEIAKQYLFFLLI